MSNLYFKLNKINQETDQTYDKCKILGSPVFPTNFLENNNLEEDYFLMQLNLNDLKDYNLPLPKEGFLYFFLNIDTYPYIPKVIYTSDEITTVYEDINECFPDQGDYNACLMEFTNNIDDAHYLLGDIDPDLDLDCEIDTTGYSILLQLDSLYLPNNTCWLGQPDGWYIFLIKDEDLKNLDFSKVKFISFGS